MHTKACLFKTPLTHESFLVFSHNLTSTASDAAKSYFLHQQGHTAL